MREIRGSSSNTPFSVKCPPPACFEAREICSGYNGDNTYTNHHHNLKCHTTIIKGRERHNFHHGLGPTNALWCLCPTYESPLCAVLSREKKAISLIPHLLPPKLLSLHTHTLGLETAARAKGGIFYDAESGPVSRTGGGGEAIISSPLSQVTSRLNNVTWYVVCTQSNFRPREDKC